MEVRRFNQLHANYELYPNDIFQVVPKAKDKIRDPATRFHRLDDPQATNKQNNSRDDPPVSWLADKVG